VAQNQQLGVLGQITTKQHGQQPEHGTDDPQLKPPGQAPNRIFERDRSLAAALADCVRIAPAPAAESATRPYHPGPDEHR
jgi:hypothetical protein